MDAVETCFYAVLDLFDDWKPIADLPETTNGRDTQAIAEGLFAAGLLERSSKVGDALYRRSMYGEVVIGDLQTAAKYNDEMRRGQD